MEMKLPAKRVVQRIPADTEIFLNVLCVKPELSILDRGNFIVLIWMI